MEYIARKCLAPSTMRTAGLTPKSHSAGPIPTSSSPFFKNLSSTPPPSSFNSFPSTPAVTTMQSSSEDIADELDSLSLNSTTTTASTAIDNKHSSSSGSDLTCAPPRIAASSAKPHAPTGDPCWQAIRRAQASSDGGAIALQELQFLRRLGSGDIGSVYLVELKCAGGCRFAAKVMDKKELVSRYKEGRARIEVEILEMLDHPFLPTLYATLESPRWSCLLTEFCPGGDLHALRQRQPDKRFEEAAVRFYASEVIVALEYLHMMGIIYRDLKPENVLVRSDGHIMLTDFDLSLKNDSRSPTAQIVPGQNLGSTSMMHPSSSKAKAKQKQATPFGESSCMIPNCIVPAVSCFRPIGRRRRRKPRGRRGPEIVAEPVEMRSMSFVGTHEYLAPEIVSGEGHGNAVDWWTLGVFVFEMLYGTTPFKGADNELTLANIVARALEFPKEPWVPAAAKDLIAQLLVKEPSRRMGATMGAVAVKHHAFFSGVSWPLLRCAAPPVVPRPQNQNQNQNDLVSPVPHACPPDISIEYY